MFGLRLREVDHDAFMPDHPFFYLLGILRDC